MAESAGLLVKMRGDGQALARGRKALGLGPAAEVEPILSLPATDGLGAAAGVGASWHRLTGEAAAENPWDAAHALVARGSALAAAGAEVLAVEPDLIQQWQPGPHHDAAHDPAGLAAAPEGFRNQDGRGGKAVCRAGSDFRLAWAADADFHQFAAARKKVGERQARILVAHLDTGFDPDHRTAPENLVPPGQWRNFCDDGQPPTDAVDRIPARGLTSNPGHGTGTLSLLAGNRLDGTAPGWPRFRDFVGAAPLVRILPIRIADWVVRFSTSTMVRGFEHARSQGAHVLSMSMGGLTSAALVDAINLAYDSGLVMVTAAGNNFAARPSPKSIVFPARYQRVLAACGVMADGRPYAGLEPGTMQGNHGPAEKMATALGAYTPNVPWARIGQPDIVDMDGAGTSAATPQIAAAAALWLAEHWDMLAAYPQPWMRVEAVRQALFASAARTTARMDRGQVFDSLGQGVLRAREALKIAPGDGSDLRRLPPAQASWGWIDLIFGGGVSLAAAGLPPARRQMLALELTQMAQRVPAVEAAIRAPEADPGQIPASARNRYLEAALEAGNPSQPLRRVLESLLGARPAPTAPAPAPEAAPAPAPKPARSRRPPPPPPRRLRIYALDPAIGKRMASVAIEQAVLSLPWDDHPATPEALQPGPVGEYLEVIDIDPASNRVYAPVDLNDPILLAQDGHAPSEGNPQFHQQMAYAVAMTTIRNFEHALGRRALWAPRWRRWQDAQGRSRTEVQEVRRLRIHPHALREANAYYSPQKMALLFGYFPASGDGAATPAGSTVFTCLSSDIVAHETTHALLDGLHRRFQEASNPDVIAFHEGFADIVALFQHFTLRELVAFEIARVRGDLAAANLLSGLAMQFGEGSGRQGPLRDYASDRMADLDYASTREAHDRGSILVFAVYEAFLAIVARRIERLIGLATGGSGILPQGALHPSLVGMLTDEVVATARQVLKMCIRALDFCPAVDITFGEYLRALITADRDAYPDAGEDRLAFIESFRRWKLLPEGVRTMSEETLAWGTLADPCPDWLPGVLARIDPGWDTRLDRSAIFRLNEANRWAFWRAMNAVFRRQAGSCLPFGITEGLGRFAADGTLQRAASGPGTTFEVLGLRPTRRLGQDGSFRTELVAILQQRMPMRADGSLAPEGVAPGEDFTWFRGGATVIIDPTAGQEEIRYSIIKRTDSETRRRRQADTAAGLFASPLRQLYFGDRVAEPFALLHRGQGGSEDG